MPHGETCLAVPIASNQRNSEQRTGSDVITLNTTYTLMTKGFVCLTAVVDWASYKVLAEKVVITLEVRRVADMLQEVATVTASQRL